MWVHFDIGDSLEYSHVIFKLPHMNQQSILIGISISFTFVLKVKLNNYLMLRMWISNHPEELQFGEGKSIGPPVDLVSAVVMKV